MHYHVRPVVLVNLFAAGAMSDVDGPEEIDLADWPDALGAGRRAGQGSGSTGALPSPAPCDCASTAGRVSGRTHHGRAGAALPPDPPTLGVL
jgi:hypothetical protein